jgi:hypothetical protein
MRTSISQTLATTGDLARRHGVDRDRIDYIVKTRGVGHAALAGHVRLFDEAAQKLIADGLFAIRAKRDGGCPCN